METGEDLFDEELYLAANPDVAAAVSAGSLPNGFSHYVAFGKNEIATGIRLPMLNRISLACKYLRGHGLEIGALHNPLKLPPTAQAKYVDRCSTPELYKHYPELAQFKFVDVDIIENGEELSSLPPASQDFVIANHFLEHCQDPIRTLKNLLRVLKTRGIIYMAVPDKRFTFDKRRGVTPIEHLVADHQDGPEASRAEHYLEWAEFVEPEFERPLGSRAEIEAKAKQLERDDYSIHYHVWTLDAYQAFIEHCIKALGLPLAMVFIDLIRGEIVSILRKEV